jgi:hypothetical protein
MTYISANKHPLQINTRSISHEVSGTLIGEDGLMVMAGMESVEWYQIHTTHGFQVFMPFH